MFADDVITTAKAVAGMDRATKIEFLKSKDGKAFFSDLRKSDFYKSWTKSKNPLHKGFGKMVDALSIYTGPKDSK